MNVNDQVMIEGDNTGTVYVVAGVREGRGLWLTVEEDPYDGYDADLIVQQSDGATTYNVVLCDDRSSFRGQIRLIRLN